MIRPAPVAPFAPVAALALAAALAAPAADAQPLTGARVRAERGVAVGRDLVGSTVTVVNGMPHAQVVALVSGLTSPEPAARRAALDLLRAALPEDAARTAEAISRFFVVLGRAEAPEDRLVARFEEIARRHLALLDRLAALEPEDPEVAALLAEARVAVGALDHDRADDLLARAEDLDLAAMRRAERLAAQARAAAEARRRNVAATRAERAELAAARLDHRRAAALWRSAAEILPERRTAARWRHVSRAAGVLYARGLDFGDNAALHDAIAAYRDEVLPLAPRAERPEDWAGTQHNLGIALAALGRREAGTERLEQAVAGYRAALEEFTRARAPLDWAMTWNNLGNALRTLGEREAGTARLEQAVAAYRAALEERPRGRRRPSISASSARRSSTGPASPTVSTPPRRSSSPRGRCSRPPAPRGISPSPTTPSPGSAPSVPDRHPSRRLGAPPPAPPLGRGVEDRGEDRGTTRHDARHDAQRTHGRRMADTWPTLDAPPADARWTPGRPMPDAWTTPA